MRRPMLSPGSTATSRRASRCTMVHNNSTSSSTSSIIIIHLRLILSLIVTIIIIGKDKDMDKWGAVLVLDRQPSCQAL